MTAVSTSDESTPDAASLPDRMQRVDAWCEKWGDRLNPILVKETRQALKSRQFVLTFSFLLFAALGWTIIGSLSLMPRIYDTPSAPRMLIGYYFVLALPMLLVVPLAAYRSLEGEIDDGTLELLSITTLSPWQIVLGKLASAMLQMMLYFIALFPCVAYAYTLRGVDLPPTVLLIGMLILSGIMLTIVALFHAPLCETRGGRIVTLLSVIGILVLAEWCLGAIAVEMIQYGLDFSLESIFGLVVTAVLICIALGHLLLTVTAAQLTPISENRSTKIRVSLLMVTAVTVSLSSVWAMRSVDDGTSAGFIVAGGVALLMIWTFAGSMLVAESPVITPRVQRELPMSFLARAAFTWLTPGPATGLVFTVLNILLVASFLVIGIAWLDSSLVSMPRSFRSMFVQFVFGYAAYLTCFLVSVYVLMRLIRLTNQPRVEVGFAALAVVAVITALLPYAIGLYLSDFRTYQYSLWQSTNWAWTLYEILDNNDLSGSITVIGFVGASGSFFVLFFSPQLVWPRRIATPKRVLEEHGESGK